MSAAAKLGALDKAMPHAPTHIATWPLFWEYREALPQIVAVVEAAERAIPVSACDYPDGACENECGRGSDLFDLKDCLRLQAFRALAALDEALS